MQVLVLKREQTDYFFLKKRTIIKNKNKVRIKNKIKSKLMFSLRLQVISRKRLLTKAVFYSSTLITLEFIAEATAV